MPKLTKVVVENLPIPQAGYVLHWDSQDRGFGVRVTAQGKRSFVAQGRVLGKEVRSTIGPFGIFTVEQARSAARELLRGMRLGVDPRAERAQAIAASMTLRQVADAYLRDRNLKVSSQREIDRHVTTTFKSWSTRPISEISRDMVTKRFHEMKTTGLRGRGPAPAQANQAFSILRALVNFAVREYRNINGSPILTDNPVDVLYKKWAPIRPRTSRIPEGKVGAVWAFLTKSRQRTVSRDTLASIDLVMFLLLTGARIGEASSLTWDNVNLLDKWWHIPDPKNRNEIWLPLSTLATNVIAQRPRISGSPYVFASWGNCGHIKDPRDTMKRVSTVAEAKLSPHDLRRTFTTLGIATCGIEFSKIELLTNHVPRSITSRHYLETAHLEYLFPEVDKISQWIASAASACDERDVDRCPATGAIAIDSAATQVAAQAWPSSAA